MTSRYEELESYLLEFVRRVAVTEKSKSPEEVEVLPEIVRLLLNN